MSLITCKECGGKVSSNAATCPSCGAKPPKKTSAFTWIVGGLFAFVVAKCTFSGADEPPTRPVVASNGATIATAPPMAPATPPDPKYIKELVRIENLSSEDFCIRELRKLKGKKGAPPQPWFDALAKAGQAHGITGEHLVHIQAGGVAPGMNRCGALAAWGQPQKVNTTTNSYSTSEQWVYGNGNYLYFKNEILTSIQN